MLDEPAAKPAAPTIGCRDGCGRRVGADVIEQSGWIYLEIQKRWRCPDCWRELEQANATWREQDRPTHQGPT